MQYQLSVSRHWLVHLVTSKVSVYFWGFVKK